ncbi:MAG: DUF2062 domain-containing protein [Bacteroidia bacterium]|nr:DUF2062 domain-containing protein [Bacteroidia bacterium]
MNKKVTIRGGFKSIFCIKEDPRVVASGFALGSFIGMLPFPGFQMLISASLAACFRLNKVAAIAGVFNTNLFTGVFVFAFNYWLGRKILGIAPSFKMPEHINFSFAKTVLEAGPEVFMSLLLGGFITGIFAMITGYYISLFILTKNRQEEK